MWFVVCVCASGCGCHGGCHGDGSSDTFHLITGGVRGTVPVTPQTNIKGVMFMKRNIIIISCLLVFLLSIVGGCKPQTTQPTPNKPPVTTPEKEEVEPGQFLPLSQGNYWYYQGRGMEYASFNRKVLYTKDNLAQLSEDNGGTVTTTIYETTPGALKRVYFEGESYNPPNMLEEGLTPNEEEGLTPNENVIILKSPISVGTKWDNQDHSREIVDVNASVDTPAGTFKPCLKVKITSDNSTVYEYYKKGLGLVKREFIADETTITSSLEKYQVQ